MIITVEFRKELKTHLLTDVSSGYILCRSNREKLLSVGHIEYLVK